MRRSLISPFRKPCFPEVDSMSTSGKVSRDLSKDQFILMEAKIMLAQFQLFSKINFVERIEIRTNTTHINKNGLTVNNVQTVLLVIFII